MTTPTPHGAMPELPEAEVRAIMANAGFADTARSWSGGIEEMRYVIRAAIQQAAGAVPEGSFPSRIMSLLREVADREGTATSGPWEDEYGELLQDDADTAIAWILAASHSPLGREAACVSQNAKNEPQTILTRTDEPQREAGSSDHLVPCAVGGVTQWHVEYSYRKDSDAGVEMEWWDVTNGYAIYTAHTADAADKLCAILNAASAPRPDAPTSQIKIVVNDKLPDDVVVFMQDGKEVGRVVGINPSSAPRED